MARVLVIDDSPTAVLSVRRALALDGHQVESLRHFHDLARQLRERPPDLILLDLHMPGFSGELMGGQIQRFQIRPTKVVVYSGGEASLVRQLATQLSASGVIAKGAPPEELRRVVAAVLGDGTPP